MILLLFVAYQLWGTGLLTDRAQDRLAGELDARIEAAEEAPAPTTIPAAPPDQAATPEDLATLAPEEVTPVAAGAPLGRIDIPAIGSNWVYVEDVELRYLRDGPGHFPTTKRPGQEGNAALAGHRTTYGAPFHRIDELVPGDEIVITDDAGRVFTYEVMSAAELSAEMPFDVAPEDAENGHFIIGPSDSWILDDYGDDRITLMACHPKYSARQRIVTVGRLVGEPVPAPTPPPAPAEAADIELAGNEQAGLLPAVLWGAAAALVWAIAWFVGHRRRSLRWPAYLVGLPVFLLLLFQCFVQVERLLPAAY